MSQCSSSCGNDLDGFSTHHRKVLWFLFYINLTMFLVEMAYGWLGNSHALWADSLDMLSDALILGASIFVLNREEKLKARVALGKGILMGTLSLVFLFSALLRFLEPSNPDPEIIGVVGALALVANLICALCLFKFRNQDLNMRSTWLCARNDILANLGVIFAAGAIHLFHSFWPDILIATVICLFILNSSISIMKEALKKLSDRKALYRETA